MYVHSHSPLSRGSQVSRTSKSQEGGVVRRHTRRKGGALAKPIERDTPNTTLLNQSPGPSDARADSFIFSDLGRRLTRGLYASSGLNPQLRLTLCTVQPTLRSGAAPDQGPRSVRSNAPRRPIRVRTPAAQGAARVQHTSAGWHAEALRQRGWPTGRRPRRKLPQVPFREPARKLMPSARPVGAA